jgi:hypothetical protein
MRAIVRIRMVALCGLMTTAGAPRIVLGMQTPERPLLQLEVNDSLGLPLPNARLELYAYAEGGLFREWIEITPEMLGQGTYLLRFSHDGYRAAVFSVPLRPEAPVSLRVRLRPDAPLPVGGGPPAAVPVTAIGLALGGRSGSDIIGARRVLDRDAFERTNANGVAEVFRVHSVRKSVGAHETSGDWGVRLKNPRTGDVCDPPIMMNGDVTLTLTLARYQELYRLSEPEAIEFVLDGRAVPHTFRRGYNLNCPVMMIWLRGR